MYSLKIAVFYFFVSAPFLMADEDLKKQQMIEDLQVIKHHFEVGYAPCQWKDESFGWSLERSCQEAKEKILNTPRISTKQFQIILKNFVQTMQDYHVGINFISTEKAVLPFQVKGAANRYFITWVDQYKLPNIEVGDELIEFNNEPIAAVIAALKKEHGRQTNDLTDQALAEISLTERKGSLGEIVPKGAVTIKILPKQNNYFKAQTHQLIWSYQAESINNPLDYNLCKLSCTKNKVLADYKLTMAPLCRIDNSHKSALNPLCDGNLGASKGFLPDLGVILWKNGQNKQLVAKSGALKASIDWHAYIYNHPSIGPVGYIRIPHYDINEFDVEEFGKIVSYMEGNTHALIIDQTNNFGGFLNFQYEIASILATKPLLTPHHQLKITQKEVYNAYRELDIIKFFEYQSAPADMDWDEENYAKENSKHKIAEIAEGYRRLLFLKNYNESIIEDWNAGQVLTRPTPLLGVDMIHPHARHHYRKPKILLINEMCFSGADIMAAMLQDSNTDGNMEALLFGTRTAGAGGFVKTFEFPNRHGIKFCSYTASLAHRANSMKIENVGVSPDLEYAISIADLQNDYEEYVTVLNKVIEAWLQVN